MMQASFKIELPQGNSPEEDLISIVYALEYLHLECRKRDLKMTSHFIGVASESCKEEMKKLTLRKKGSSNTEGSGRKPAGSNKHFDS